MEMSHHMCHDVTPNFKSDVLHCTIMQGDSLTGTIMQGDSLTTELCRAMTSHPNRKWKENRGGW